MCGRYKQSTKAQEIAAAFALDAVYEPPPRYNIAPTDVVPVVRVVDGQRVLRPMRFGLVPFWAKDESVGNRMLNARIETVFEKPAFKESLQKRRCLVVTDGFYEWRRFGTGTKDKEPHLFCFADRHVFAFGGLYALWRGPMGPVESFSIITTAPNALAAAVHDRMPLIFDPHADRERLAAWLDPEVHDVDLPALMTPRDIPGFTHFAVSGRVGNVRNDDPSLVEPAAPHAPHEGDPPTARAPGRSRKKAKPAPMEAGGQLGLKLT